MCFRSAPYQLFTWRIQLKGRLTFGVLLESKPERKSPGYIKRAEMLAFNRDNGFVWYAERLPWFRVSV